MCCFLGNQLEPRFSIKSLGQNALWPVGHLAEPTQSALEEGLLTAQGSLRQAGALPWVIRWRVTSTQCHCVPNVGQGLRVFPHQKARAGLKMGAAALTAPQGTAWGQGTPGKWRLQEPCQSRGTAWCRLLPRWDLSPGPQLHRSGEKSSLPRGEKRGNRAETSKPASPGFRSPFQIPKAPPGILEGWGGGATFPTEESPSQWTRTQLSCVHFHSLRARAHFWGPLGAEVSPCALIPPLSFPAFFILSPAKGR